MPDGSLNRFEFGATVWSIDDFEPVSGSRHGPGSEWESFFVMIAMP
jgi:hypothetical protein